MPSVRSTLNLPLTAGNYAPEVVYCNIAQVASKGDPVRLLSIQNEVAVPASAAIEVDQLKPGGDPAVSGDWLLAVRTIPAATAAGLQTEMAFVGGVLRIRGKSGGAVVAVPVSIWWQRAENV